MAEENRLGSDRSLRPYIATRFREETTMVSHLISDGGIFLPLCNERSEGTPTRAERAVEVMLYFKATNCTESRNWLIEYYMHTFVRSIARRIASGLPKSIDPDDLEQVGFFGLLDCIEKYKPELMFKFETYARKIACSSWSVGHLPNCAWNAHIPRAIIFVLLRASLEAGSTRRKWSRMEPSTLLRAYVSNLNMSSGLYFSIQSSKPKKPTCSKSSGSILFGSPEAIRLAMLRTKVCM